MSGPDPGPAGDQRLQAELCDRRAARQPLEIIGRSATSVPGRIVNIASIAGKEGNPNASAYSASKAGVIGLTESLGIDNNGATTTDD